METKSRKIILAGTICYTILVLFFMFFAFNRLDSVTSVERYTFILIPERVPLKFPDLNYSWIVDFGNIAAFIPFGILFPLLYRVRFGKFISLFVLAILVLETIQALTYLGSFDVNDVISNTLGAMIGYVTYRVGFSSKISYKKLMASTLSIVVLINGVMVVSEIIKKREGPIQTLNVMKEMTGTTPIIENLPNFTVAGERIEPKMNVYSSEGESTKTYNYILGNKENVWLYFYFGIPDNVDFKGEAKIIVDGQEVYRLNEQSSQGSEALRELPFNKVNELTISVSGNAKLWDIGIRGMQHWWE
ncbi:VanZ family protein [Bacillus pseudomycoides]|uniref:VanZ family protein n=1 Tax=Bacillus pseudomycoides TaxID=64104 RepID=UPI000BEC70AD|nr:VanZ family protein [Bacillus pseudomycoides]PEF72232.1 VanZ family protein [Bacillus pseudomycoides]PEI49347.1 VanZ family protein [Bacillus pseudomycoides]PEL78853.1 VanZ family protein [Bacillus pseudomycoides]PGA65918.1 VanZ family protein [Bacillus pseudomycoides]PHE07538.1 VanZ family protein [Bacillus pseudomycoides]